MLEFIVGLITFLIIIVIFNTRMTKTLCMAMKNQHKRKAMKKNNCLLSAHTKSGDKTDAIIKTNGNINERTNE